MARQVDLIVEIGGAVVAPEPVFATPPALRESILNHARMIMSRVNTAQNKAANSMINENSQPLHNPIQLTQYKPMINSTLQKAITIVGRLQPYKPVLLIMQPGAQG